MRAAQSGVSFNTLAFIFNSRLPHRPPPPPSTPQTHTFARLPALPQNTPADQTSALPLQRGPSELAF